MTTVSEPPASVIAPLERQRLTAVDTVGVLFAIVLMCAYLPVVSLEWDTPRFVALLGLLPVGLVLLIRAALDREIPALAAALVIGWVVAGSLLSAAPFISMFGSLGRWSSSLLLVAVLAAWAVGREMTDQGRAVLPWAIVSAGALSASFALLQLITDPTVVALSLEQGRPVGLVGNPIYFGAQMASLAAFFSYRFIDSNRPWVLIGWSVFAFAAALSGSRIALLTVIAVSFLPFVRTRSLTKVVLLPLAVVASVMAGVLHDRFGTGQSAGARIGTGGVQDRLDLWGFGLRAWLERPVLGWGLGQFRSASQGHYSDAWAGRFSDDRSGGWMDAHNFVVEHLVTTGIVGVAAILFFVVAASARTSGVWGWMAGSLALGWLLEPAALPTFGLAAILLGAAAARPNLLPVSNAWRTATTWALALGLVLGAWHTVNMYYLERWIPPAASERSLPVWAFWLRFDPLVASSAASSVPSGEALDRADEEFELYWAERAAELEPDLPYWRSSYALALLGADDLEGAQSEVEAALERQPNNVRSLTVLQIVAIRTGDESLFERTTERLCALGSPACESAPPGS